MEYGSPHTERRKHQRHQIPELVIAVTQVSDSKFARVVNLSKGGMAVRYVDQSNWLGEAREVNILVKSDFFLTDVPVKSVRDFEVENQVPFSNILERQCCLQFGSLSPAQESLLEEFIMNHSAGNS